MDAEGKEDSKIKVEDREDWNELNAEEVDSNKDEIGGGECESGSKEDKVVWSEDTREATGDAVEVDATPPRTNKDETVNSKDGGKVEEKDAGSELKEVSVDIQKILQKGVWENTIDRVECVDKEWG
uniref:Uncharacterized protein n=1 Tax=Lygus hesperus TaxID=30085 RepID=A0A0A9XZ16_LYGHE